MQEKPGQPEDFLTGLLKMKQKVWCTEDQWALASLKTANF
jgi:hypothetical protein